MRITAVFDSLEEFLVFRQPVKIIAKEPEPSAKPAETVTEPAETVTEPAETVTEPAETVAEGPDYEELRIKVRKTLAQLNKKISGNPAKKLIQSFGKEKLTEIVNEDLQALLEKAEEAINAG